MNSNSNMPLFPPMRPEQLPDRPQESAQQRAAAQKCACSDWQGELPSCAPLANPYVPFQMTGSSKYEAGKALVRGTLFEGLDLPFMGMVNKSEKAATPLHRLQALGFAAHELGLYLDTHPEDEDALDLFRSYAAMAAKAREEYEKAHGPLRMMSAGENGCYNWLCGPWPWEFGASEEAK